MSTIRTKLFLNTAITLAAVSAVGVASWWSFQAIEHNLTSFAGKSLPARIASADLSLDLQGAMADMVRMTMVRDAAEAGQIRQAGLDKINRAAKAGEQLQKLGAGDGGDAVSGAKSSLEAIHAATVEHLTADATAAEARKKAEEAVAQVRRGISGLSGVVITSTRKGDVNYGESQKQATEAISQADISEQLKVAAYLIQTKVTELALVQNPRRLVILKNAINSSTADMVKLATRVGGKTETGFKAIAALIPGLIDAKSKALAGDAEAAKKFEAVLSETKNLSDEMVISVTQEGTVLKDRQSKAFTERDKVYQTVKGLTTIQKAAGDASGAAGDAEAAVGTIMSSKSKAAMDNAAVRLQAALARAAGAVTDIRKAAGRDSGIKSAADMVAGGFGQLRSATTAENGLLAAVAKRHAAAERSTTALDVAKKVSAKIAEDSIRTVSSTDADQAKALAGIKSAMTAGYVMIVAAGLAGILFAMAVSVWISRSILKPLNSLSAMLEDVAQGEGDLTKRLDDTGNDEVAAACRWFNSFVAKLQTSVSNAKETATETAVASQELSHIAANLNNTVQQQCRVVEETGSLTNEVTQSLDMTEEMAITTTETIEATRDLMTRFVENLNQAGGVIINEADNQRELAGRMQELAERAGNIREVLQIISDIADQTNLLALNASIEAARAGDMGRGFAVVADEVRKLASKTQDSLAQINESVTGVVNGVEELYGESERSSSRMLGISESTKGLISSADESGQRLSAAVRISSDLVKKSTFIATRTKQLMEQMEQMSTVAEQNLSVAAEVEDVSSSMAEKSENLRGNLGRFRC